MTDGALHLFPCLTVIEREILGVSIYCPPPNQTVLPASFPLQIIQLFCYKLGLESHVKQLSKSFTMAVQWPATPQALSCLVNGCLEGYMNEELGYSMETSPLPSHLCWTASRLDLNHRCHRLPGQMAGPNRMPLGYMQWANLHPLIIKFKKCIKMYSKLERWLSG